jgi:hypothetical protein
LKLPQMLLLLIWIMVTSMVLVSQCVQIVTSGTRLAVSVFLYPVHRRLHHLDIQVLNQVIVRVIRSNQLGAPPKHHLCSHLRNLLVEIVKLASVVQSRGHQVLNRLPQSTGPPESHSLPNQLMEDGLPHQPLEVLDHQLWLIDKFSLGLLRRWNCFDSRWYVFLLALTQVLNCFDMMP